MQTTLNMYINKKLQNQPQNDRKPATNNTSHHQYHQSSRQNSDTEILEPISSYMKQQSFHKVTELCKCLILPGPADSVYFPSTLNKLRNLKDNYNSNHRGIFYQFVEGMLRYEKVQNVDILKRVDDNVFWKFTLPKMINLMITKAQTVSACIPTLVLTNKTSCIITRQQALILLIGMFFCMMPRNPLCRTKSFGEFMTKRPGGDKYQDLKLQKLKFIITYFNIAVERISSDNEFAIETITFQKAISNSYQLRSSLNTEDYHRQVQMVDVEFCENLQGKIQDYYGNAAMVDFANQSIGGGVLRSGCVQEEILFLIFPQAIVSMLISPQMFENQAIIIYGLRRYSNYQNYSYTLKYDGPFKDTLQNVNDSVMIAIDAINFSPKINIDVQFNKQNTFRQIVKATTGFIGIDFLVSSEMKICTGRWGCGAFKGDQIWKFFIQWIACSQSGHQMVYVSDQHDIAMQLKSAVKRLTQKRLNTVDMFALMEHFIEAKQKRNTPKQHNFIQFLKSHIL